MRPCGCNHAAATVDGRNTIARYPRLAFPSLSVAVIILSVRREDERERKRETQKGEESKREEAEERHRASERERRPDGGERVA